MSDDETIAPPTPIARRFVRLVAGFGVGVAVGLAPFLGKVDVPGFQALLTLYPQSLRDPLITLSAFLMGVVAVGVQFYAGERISRADLRRRFKLGLGVLAGGLAALTVLWVLFVVRVPTSGEAFSSIVAGARLPTCDCGGLTDLQCIRSLSADPEALSTCWGGPAYKSVQLAFIASYLVLTGGFGVIIGLLLLQERARRERARRRGSKSSAPATRNGSTSGAS